MKKLRCFSIMIALGFSLSCADENTQDRRYTEDALDAPGPYTVGFQRTSITYDAPGVNEHRTIPVLVWYPGVKTETARRTKFTLMGAVPIGKARAYDRIPLDGDDPHPLAIYSHGSGGEASLVYPYAEQLASRGWIVAAIDHVGNTTADMLSDGDAGVIASSVHRPLDVSQVIDAAAQGFGWDGFEDRIDAENTFVFGHSFGGFTSLLLGGAVYQKDKADALACDDAPDSDACAFLQAPDVVEAIERGFRDVRVQAIGLQAPSMMGVLRAEGVEVPTLLLTGDRDKTTTHENASVPIWDGLNHPADLWVRFADAGHFSFITVCDIFGTAAIATFEPSAPEDGCGPDFLPTTEVARIVSAYLVTFAEFHILDIPSWEPFALGNQRLTLEGDADIEHQRHP